MHDAASSGCFSCPVGLPNLSDSGLFLVKPCTSEYDKSKGYTFSITIQKGVYLSENTAPFIPSQSQLAAYCKDNGITKLINEWNRGYTIKMYVPYSKRYNLLQVVALEGLRAVSTKHGTKDLLETYLISGVQCEGTIKMSIWGEEARLMHGVLK